MKAPARPTRFRNLTLGLIAAILLPPFLRPAFPLASMVGSFVFVALVGRVVFGSRSRLFRAVMAVAMSAVAVRAAGVDQLLGSVPWGVRMALGVLVSLGLVFVVIEMLGHVLDRGPVDTERLYAASSAFLLIGLAYASVFEALMLWKPGAFTLPPAAYDDHEALLYFSLVTLSTVGYGDMLPSAPEARILAVSEAVVGQLYLAILMARLVGLHLEHSRAPSMSSDAPPAKPLAPEAEVP